MLRIRIGQETVSKTAGRKRLTGSSPVRSAIYAHISLIGKARAWKARSNRDERREGSSPSVSATVLINVPPVNKPRILNRIRGLFFPQTMIQ